MKNKILLLAGCCFFSSSVLFANNLKTALIPSLPFQVGEQTESLHKAPEKKPLKIAIKNTDSAKFIAQVVDKICLEGVTVFKISDLEPLYKQYLGTKIDQATLEKILTSIDDHYYKNNYLLTKSSRSPRDTFIDKNCLHIKIYEGKISKVFLFGKMQNSKFLEKSAKAIADIKPFNFDKFDHYFSTITGLEGVNAVPVFSPDPTAQDPLDNKLVLFNNRKTMAGKFYLDNRSYTKSKNGLQTGLDLQFYDLLKLDETLKFSASVSGSFSRDKWFVGSLFMPITPSGLSFNTRVAYFSGIPGIVPIMETDTQVGLIKKWSDNWSIKYKIFGAGLNQHLYKSYSSYFDVLGGVSIGHFEKNNKHLSNSNTEKNVSNSVYFGFETLFPDKFNSNNYANLFVFKALDCLGTKSSIKNPIFKNNFTKFSAAFTRRDDFPGKFFFLLTKIKSQHTADNLIEEEKFGGGGKFVGRGIKSEYISGDKGITASVEFHYSQYPKSVPILSLVDYYSFVDSGIAKNNKYHNGGQEPNNYRKSQSMLSTGVGINFYFVNKFAFNIELAKPLYLKNYIKDQVLADNNYNKKKLRFFFGADYSFDF